MGHVERADNEDRRVLEVVDSIRRGEMERAVLIVVEYNMKLEPILFRETSTAFFGKRGMSWHGSMLLYKKEAGVPARREDVISGNVEELSRRVIDHILKNGNTLDFWVAAMLMEEIVSRAPLLLPLPTNL